MTRTFLLYKSAVRSVLLMSVAGLATACVQAQQEPPTFTRAVPSESPVIRATIEPDVIPAFPQVRNLTDYGMKFIGGRLFFVNGMPVAQLAYHDQQGRLLGFCFMRNPSSIEKTPDQTRNGDDLYLIDWKDDTYQYVLIGFEDFQTLEPIADELAETYRYET